MAISTMDGLINGLANTNKTNFLKVSMTAEGASTYQSLLKANGFPIAGPTPPATNGEIPIMSAVGAIPWITAEGANKKYLARVSMTGSTVGTLIIYDRLFHNSGLVGNVATIQSFTQPALTRYTNGVGVEIFGEIYTAVGATSATFSANYTDANNAARVATYAHPANAESTGQMFLFVPPTDARGCKSVQSVILSTSTGTAGNWGIVLLKRLAEIPISIINVNTTQDSFMLGMPEIVPNAALFTMVQCTATNTGNIMGTIDIIEG